MESKMEEPKLIFNFFPSNSRRAESPAGTVTPPIQLPGAVPFWWEEAPGRPKQKTSQLSENTTGRSPSASADADSRLSLPPRLSASASIKKMMKWDARVDNLDDITPNSSSSSSSGSLSSFKSLSSSGSYVGWYSAGGGWESDGEVVVGGGEKEGRRYKRKRTTLTSFTASHFWNGVFGRLKHAIVPCRRNPKF